MVRRVDVGRVVGPEAGELLDRPALPVAQQPRPGRRTAPRSPSPPARGRCTEISVLSGSGVSGGLGRIGAERSTRGIERGRLRSGPDGERGARRPSARNVRTFSGHAALRLSLRCVRRDLRGADRPRRGAGLPGLRGRRGPAALHADPRRRRSSGCGGRRSATPTRGAPSARSSRRSRSAPSGARSAREARARSWGVPRCGRGAGAPMLPPMLRTTALLLALAAAALVAPAGAGAATLTLDAHGHTIHYTAAPGEANRVNMWVLDVGYGIVKDDALPGLTGCDGPLIEPGWRHCVNGRRPQVELKDGDDHANIADGGSDEGLWIGPAHVDLGPGDDWVRTGYADDKLIGGPGERHLRAPARREPRRRRHGRRHLQRLLRRRHLHRRPGRRHVQRPRRQRQDRRRRRRRNGRDQLQRRHRHRDRRPRRHGRRRLRDREPRDGAGGARAERPGARAGRRGPAGRRGAGTGRSARAG